jgi:hypothetical protein
MNALNFIPLLIWALAYMPLFELAFKIKGSTYDDKTAEAGARIYLGGILLFSLIGVFCCLV